MARRGKIWITPNKKTKTFENAENDNQILYCWLQIQTDSEELLIIKTRESLLEEVKEHVKANHEYE